MLWRHSQRLIERLSLFRFCEVHHRIGSFGEGNFHLSLTLWQMTRIIHQWLYSVSQALWSFSRLYGSFYNFVLRMVDSCCENDTRKREIFQRQKKILIGRIINGELLKALQGQTGILVNFLKWSASADKLNGDGFAFFVASVFVTFIKTSLKSVVHVPF